MPDRWIYTKGETCKLQVKDLQKELDYLGYRSEKAVSEAGTYHVIEPFPKQERITLSVMRLLFTKMPLIFGTAKKFHSELKLVLPIIK